MTKDALEFLLKRLALLHVQLNDAGGPANNGHLFEEMLSMQDEALNSFGLPASPENTELLSFESIPTKLEMDKLITKLNAKATHYLLGKTSSDVTILKEACEAQKDGMYVLPEIKISTHVYTLFIYNKILLKRKESAENVLNDLRHCNQYDILNALGQITYGRTDHEPELIEYLQSCGIRYLQQFIMYSSDLLSDDDY